MAKAAKAEVAKKGPSKAHMVRAAVEALGADAKPVAIQSKIQELFSTEISTQMIASYKSNMKKGGRRGSGTVNVTDLETIRGLIHRLGANQLQELISFLTK